MTPSVIVDGARTPIGSSAAGSRTVRPSSWAARHQGGARSAGVAPDQVDYVIMGQVLQAGAGQITARQAAIDGGIPKEVPAITINKVCLSGLNAIALADQLIRAGEVEVVVAGGMESMSQAPYLIPSARWGHSAGERRDRGLDGLRRAVVHVHGPAHGRLVRRGEHRARI